MGPKWAPLTTQPGGDITTRIVHRGSLPAVLLFRPEQATRNNEGVCKVLCRKKRRKEENTEQIAHCAKSSGARLSPAVRHGPSCPHWVRPRRTIAHCRSEWQGGELGWRCCSGLWGGLQQGSTSHRLDLSTNCLSILPFEIFFWNRAAARPSHIRTWLSPWYPEVAATRRPQHDATLLGSLRTCLGS